MIELLAQTLEVRADFLKPSGQDTVEFRSCFRESDRSVCESWAYLLDRELANVTRYGIQATETLELSEDLDLELRFGAYHAEDWQQAAVGATARYQLDDLRLEAFVDHGGFIGSPIAVEQENTFINVGVQASYRSLPWDFRLRAEESFVSDGNSITQLTGVAGYSWAPWLRTEARAYYRHADFGSQAYWSPDSYSTYSLVTTAQLPLSATTGIGVGLGLGLEAKDGDVTLGFPFGLGIRQQFGDTVCNLGGRYGYGVTIFGSCSYSF